MLDVPRLLDRTPLFQTMFTMHTEDAAGTDVLPGVTADFFDPGVRQAKFELSLDAWRTGDGLRLIFGYRADLFDRATVARLSGRFAALLGAVLAAPDAPLSTVDAAGDGADRARLLAAPGPHGPARHHRRGAGAAGSTCRPATTAEELVAERLVRGPRPGPGRRPRRLLRPRRALAARHEGRRPAARRHRHRPARSGTCSATPTSAGLADAVEELLIAELDRLTDEEAAALLAPDEEPTP